MIYRDLKVYCDVMVRLKGGNTLLRSFSKKLVAAAFNSYSIVNFGGFFCFDLWSI